MKFLANSQRDLSFPGSIYSAFFVLPCIDGERFWGNEETKLPVLELVLCRYGDCDVLPGTNQPFLLSNAKCVKLGIPLAFFSG